MKIRASVAKLRANTVTVGKVFSRILSSNSSPAPKPNKCNLLDRLTPPTTQRPIGHHEFSDDEVWASPVEPVHARIASAEHRDGLARELAGF